MKLNCSQGSSEIVCGSVLRSPRGLSGGVRGASGLLEVCGGAFGSSWAHLGVGAVASLASWWAGAIFYWLCVVLGNQRRVFWALKSVGKGVQMKMKNQMSSEMIFCMILKLLLGRKYSFSRRDLL